MTTTVQNIIDFVNSGKLETTPLYIFDFQFIDNGKTLNVFKHRLIRIHDHRNFQTDLIIFTVEDREGKLKQTSYSMPQRSIELVATNQIELDWLIKVEILRRTAQCKLEIENLQTVINNYQSFLDN